MRSGGASYQNAWCHGAPGMAMARARARQLDPARAAHYDAYARMIAPFLADELGAEVIVENQPGAGGLSAAASSRTRRSATAPTSGRGGTR